MDNNYDEIQYNKLQYDVIPPYYDIKKTQQQPEQKEMPHVNGMNIPINCNKENTELYKNTLKNNPIDEEYKEECNRNLYGVMIEDALYKNIHKNEKVNITNNYASAWRYSETPINPNWRQNIIEHDNTLTYVDKKCLFCIIFTSGMLYLVYYICKNAF